MNASKKSYARGHDERWFDSCRGSDIFVCEAVRLLASCHAIFLFLLPVELLQALPHE
jgi:hypothetical protein